MKTITKTYTLVDPDGRGCAALEYTERMNAAGDDIVEGVVNCNIPPILCINIETVQVTGKRYMSKVGFCAVHSPSKYKRWFKMEATP